MNNKKQNNNNHQNNKQQPKRMPMPKNPDMMSNTKLMAKEGMRAIKDMAYGKYNIYNEGHVFRNPEFTKATIDEIDKRLVTLEIHIKSINIAFAGSSDPAVLNVLRRDTKEYEAYILCRNVLWAIIQTGDTGMLYTLASRLPMYKYNI